MQTVILQYISKSSLPMFSSRSFLVSDVIFRSLTHFEFTFCIWCEEMSNLFLLYVVIWCCLWYSYFQPRLPPQRPLGLSLGLGNILEFEAIETRILTNSL